MSNLLVWREKLQKLYSRYSGFIDKAIQFLLALITFFAINNSIGIVKILASPVVAIGLALVCTFLPKIFMVICAVVLVLVNVAELSLGIAGVCGIVFFIMFAFYCQFAPGKAWVIVLTSVASIFRLPYLVAIALGFLFAPAIAIPMVFGTIAYFMIDFVKTSAAAIASANGIMGQITLFVKSVFLDKEMWIACVAVVVCVCVVYVIRRQSIDYAWTLAAAAGVLANIVVYVIGSVVGKVQISYGELIIGNVIAFGIGLVLQFLFFSVDYSRTEKVQFEDDEYYYYVKAVPKITISEPDRIIKQISGRKKAAEEEEKETSKKTEEKTTEEILLEKSLQEELEVQEIVNRELEEK